MKKEIEEIVKRSGINLEHADAKDAAEEICSLLSVRLSSLRTKLEEGKSRWAHKYEDASDDSQHEMEGYHWALNDAIRLLISDEA